MTTNDKSVAFVMHSLIQWIIRWETIAYLYDCLNLWKPRQIWGKTSARDFYCDWKPRGTSVREGWGRYLIENSQNKVKTYRFLLLEFSINILAFYYECRSLIS